MNDVLLLHPAHTLVVLMGTSVYDDPKWLSLPQVENNIKWFGDCLKNPSILGIPEKNIVHIRTENDKIAKRDLDKKVLRKQDIDRFIYVLFYYAGHGVKKMRNEKKLMLTCSNTVKNDDLHSDAVEFNDILEIFKSLNHLQAKLFIIDCCHAGAIDDDLLGGETSANYYKDLNLDLQGSYFIGAAPKDEVAGAGNAMFGGEYTELTGVLCRRMSAGLVADWHLKSLISSDILEHCLNNSNLTTPPFFLNRLKSKTDKSNFFVFKNTAFSLAKIKSLLLEEDKRQTAIKLFERYLSEKEAKHLSAEAKEIKIITDLIFNR